MKKFDFITCHSFPALKLLLMKQVCNRVIQKLCEVFSLLNTFYIPMDANAPPPLHLSLPLKLFWEFFEGLSTINLFQIYIL
jgi:hypothetical protein